MKVYLLQHSYEKEIDEDLRADETKIIGIYSSYENAERVKEEYKNIEGFNRFPEDCFCIDAYELDQNNWTDGFVNSDEVDKDFELLKVCFIEWLDITEDPQDFWADPKYYNALCEIHENVYENNDVVELAKCIQQIWSKRFNDSNINLNEFIKFAIKIRATLKLL